MLSCLARCMSFNGVFNLGGGGGEDGRVGGVQVKSECPEKSSKIGRVWELLEIFDFNGPRAKN